MRRNLCVPTVAATLFILCNPLPTRGAPAQPSCKGYDEAKASIREAFISGEAPDKANSLVKKMEQDADTAGRQGDAGDVQGPQEGRPCDREKIKELQDKIERVDSIQNHPKLPVVESVKSAEEMDKTVVSQYLRLIEKAARDLELSEPETMAAKKAYLKRKSPVPVRMGPEDEESWTRHLRSREETAKNLGQGQNTINGRLARFGKALGQGPQAESMPSLPHAPIGLGPAPEPVKGLSLRPGQAPGATRPEDLTEAAVPGPRTIRTAAPPPAAAPPEDLERVRQWTSGSQTSLQRGNADMTVSPMNAVRKGLTDPGNRATVAAGAAGGALGTAAKAVDAEADMVQRLLQRRAGPGPIAEGAPLLGRQGEPIAEPARLREGPIQAIEAGSQSAAEDAVLRRHFGGRPIAEAAKAGERVQKPIEAGAVPGGLNEAEKAQLDRHFGGKPIAEAAKTSEWSQRPVDAGAVPGGPSEAEKAQLDRHLGGKPIAEAAKAGERVQKPIEAGAVPGGLSEAEKAQLDRHFGGKPIAEAAKTSEWSQRPVEAGATAP